MGPNPRLLVPIYQLHLFYVNKDVWQLQQITPVYKQRRIQIVRTIRYHCTNLWEVLYF